MFHSFSNFHIRNGWLVSASKSTKQSKAYLQQFPDVSVDKVLDGTFGTDLKATCDQFPARTFGGPERLLQP